MPIPAASTLGSFVNQAQDEMTSLDPYWHKGLTSVAWSKLKMKIESVWSSSDNIADGLYSYLEAVKARAVPVFSANDKGFIDSRVSTKTKVSK